jgi:hypothetical protein
MPGGGGVQPLLFFGITGLFRRRFLFGCYELFGGLQG